jgi:hypothetical protein
LLSRIVRQIGYYKAADGAQSYRYETETLFTWTGNFVAAAFANELGVTTPHIVRVDGKLDGKLRYEE